MLNAKERETLILVSCVAPSSRHVQGDHQRERERNKRQTERDAVRLLMCFPHCRGLIKVQHSFAAPFRLAALFRWPISNL